MKSMKIKLQSSALDELYEAGEFESADELLDWLLYCHEELTHVCQESRVDHGLPKQSLKEFRRECYELATGSFLGF